MDKSIEEETNLIEEYQDSSAQVENNALVLNINSDSTNPTIYTIENNKTSSVLNSTEAANVKELVKERDLPYPDLNEINKIEIKNEEYFKSEEKISNYLKNKNKYDDKKYNRCKICNNNDNFYYCTKCNLNLCVNCSKNNKECNHVLINLENFKIEANESINDINRIIRKIFIKPKKENHGEKSIKIRDVNNLDISENKDEIDESIESHKKQDDLELIERIIKADYNNYFHYNNILECKKYLENRYFRCFNKCCLIINYNSELFKIDDEIQIFGDDFVKNYRDKFALIINNEYSDHLIPNTKIKDNYLEVILVQNSEDEIKDLSCMFQNCVFLKNFEEYKGHKLINFKDVEDISYMFNGCTEIKILDLILFPSFEKVTKMESVFSDCRNLTEIIGFDQWNTNKVKTMASMFNGCEQLDKINGIKRFKTKNVTDFSEMFCNCEKLKIISDIKGWDMEKAKNLNGMFKNCVNLKDLKYISWEPKNIKTMEEMFSGCKSLENLPDFSKWNMKNVENINEMFKDCRSSKNLPNISEWNLKGKVKKSRVFDGCKNK